MRIKKIGNIHNSGVMNFGNIHGNVSTAGPNPSKSPPPASTAPGPEESPTPASLRRLVNPIVISDSDLEAFCHDYFPAAYAHFGSGMDRVAKVTELLSRASVDEILG